MTSKQYRTKKNKVSVLNKNITKAIVATSLAGQIVPLANDYLQSNTILVASAQDRHVEEDTENLSQPGDTNNIAVRDAKVTRDSDGSNTANIGNKATISFTLDVKEGVKAGDQYHFRFSNKAINMIDNSKTSVDAFYSSKLIGTRDIVVTVNGQDVVVGHLEDSVITFNENIESLGDVSLEFTNSNNIGGKFSEKGDIEYVENISIFINGVEKGSASHHTNTWVWSTKSNASGSVPVAEGVNSDGNYNVSIAGRTSNWLKNKGDTFNMHVSLPDEISLDKLKDHIYLVMGSNENIISEADSNVTYGIEERFRADETNDVVDIQLDKISDTEANIKLTLKKDVPKSFFTIYGSRGLYNINQETMSKLSISEKGRLSLNEPIVLTYTGNLIDGTETRELGSLGLPNMTQDGEGNWLPIPSSYRTREPLPYKTVRRLNPELEPGSEDQVIQKGKAGYIEEYRISEFNPNTLKTTVTDEGKNRVEPEDHIIEYAPEKVPFETERRLNPELEPGSEDQVVQEGKPGLRDPETDKIIDEAVNHIIEYAPVRIPYEVIHELNKDLEPGTTQVVQEGEFGLKDPETNDVVLEKVDHIIEYAPDLIPFETERRLNPELEPGSEDQVVQEGEPGLRDPETDEIIDEPVEAIIEYAPEKVPFETERRLNPELEPGSEDQVVQEGKPGLRDPETDEIIDEPIEEIIEYAPEEIPFETERVENPELEPGEEKVVQEGKPGLFDPQTGETIEEPIAEIIEFGPCVIEDQDELEEDTPTEEEEESTTEEPSSDDDFEEPEQEQDSTESEQTKESQAPEKAPVEKEKPTQQKRSQRLPDTATGAWALGLLGTLTLGVGSAVSFFSRKKKSNDDTSSDSSDSE